MAPPAPPPAPTPTPSPASPPPAAAKKDDELLDLDSMDIGGVPLSTLRASKPVIAADAPVAANVPAMPDISTPAPIDKAAEPPPPPAPAVEAPSAGLLDDAFEADPFAIAATPNAAPSAPVIDEPPQPPTELATDLVLGLPDDGTSESTSATHSALDGLQTFESGVIAEANQIEPMPLDTGSFFEMPTSSEPTEPPPPPAVEPPAPVFDAADETPAAPEPAAAFVTETMAELYLQQGHLESALDIYRRLVEMRPDDAALRARLSAVEEQIFGTAAAAESTDAAAGEQATPTAYGGPTIREFLSGLVMRAATPAQFTPAQSTPAVGVQSAEPEPSTPQPEFTTPLEPPAPPARPTPSSSQTVSESLDVFFGGADTAEPDATAANTLAEAFAPEGPGTVPLQGMPAHRASNELSLDHVFKGGGAQPGAGDAGAENFSFDQFFSPEATEEAKPGAESGGAAAAEASDDIAQFNAWLNGLKKT
jgi:hypothetical protein